MELQRDDVVPWIEGACHKRFGTLYEDPDRAIRKLHDMGLLIKVGKAELDNAQTLCGSQDYRKNRLGQLEFVADMFKRLRRKAKAGANTETEAQQVVRFCDEILALFAKFNFDDRRSVD